MKRQYVLNVMAGVVALACLGIALPVQAQVTPFDLVGHIQKFTLDTPTDTFSAAKLTVNGIQITIPKNLVIQFPAAYFTAQQAFESAQGISKNNKESGLALGDKVPPLAAFEVAVAGNIVDGEYRAGLVSISQQSLNISAGFIHSIDVTQPPSKTSGMMCVGASPTATTCQSGDTRIRLNDPALTSNPFVGDGRYGMPNPGPPVGADDPNSNYYPSRYPDPRFTVDQGNPTVHALTGYPMCVPRSNNDGECPNLNRPATLTFVMNSQDLIPPVRFGNDVISACPTCDDSKQAPVRVGDYVTFAGTLAQDAPGKEGIFVSVHTLVANVGIYTKPGGKRAYVSLDESLLGTRGPITVCASAAECQDRLKIEGFTTDPSRRVSVYAVDVLKSDRKTPGPGTPRVRLLHSTEKVQAVFGRFRYVPPLTSAALFDLNGDLKGATRELMVRIDDPDALPDGDEVPDGPKTAHGLVSGIYVAPVGEYIFPEPTGVQGGIPGNTEKPNLPELNFHCLSFLVNGWSLLPDLPTIEQLEPWPGKPSPTLSCTN